MDGEHKLWELVRLFRWHLALWPWIWRKFALWSKRREKVAQRQDWCRWIWLVHIITTDPAHQLPWYASTCGDYEWNIKLLRRAASSVESLCGNLYWHCTELCKQRWRSMRQRCAAQV